MATVSLQLHGEARGGNLIFSDIMNASPFYAEISTSLGEPADSVARRLEAAITIVWGDTWDPALLSVSGATINGLFTSGFSLSGSETGLGIPRPPHSLTAQYDEAIDGFRLNWKNGESYDELLVNCNGSTKHLPGQTTEYIKSSLSKFKPLTDRDASDSYFVICAIKNGTPSAAAAVAAYYDVQQEGLNYAGRDGVATNWTEWREDFTTPSSIVSSLKNRMARRPRHKPFSMVEKQFYQSVLLGPNGGAGLQREFIGLKPGHTYRVSLATNLDPGVRVRGGVIAPGLHLDGRTPSTKCASTWLMAQDAMQPRIPIKDVPAQWHVIGTTMVLSGDSSALAVWVLNESNNSAQAEIDMLTIEDLSSTSSVTAH